MEKNLMDRLVGYYGFTKLEIAAMEKIYETLRMGLDSIELDIEAGYMEKTIVNNSFAMHYKDDSDELYVAVGSLEILNEMDLDGNFEFDYDSSLAYLNNDDIYNGF